MLSDGAQYIAGLRLNNKFQFSVLKYIDILLFFTATRIRLCADFFQFSEVAGFEIRTF